jgi:sirohydrochlorin cobaltochelatase
MVAEKMTRTCVLMVGHGSRRPAAVAEFCDLARDVAAAVAWPVQTCFLELADPDLATGLEAAARTVGAGGQVLVAPMFLGAANHEKNDLPAAIHWARQQFSGVTFRYATPLGPHAHLVDLLDVRVREALNAAADGALPAEDTAVVIIGRGSSDPDSNSEVARVAHLLFERRPYRLVTHAFQAVARPTMEEALRQCLLLKVPQVVLAPYVLFTGRVYEDILAAAECGRAAGLRVLTAHYLAPHPHLVAIVRQRLMEALEGQAAMTCDLCKYRLPMAGYEHQVGEVQHTHHLHGGSQGHQHTHHAEHDHPTGAGSA